ncbi:ABC transporter permease [Actinoplanes sp. NPDC049265]|uniref:ABC transporter permease n=1 Tax=Actinoplanes sp. NPDC049265 TaxID=3363902 RepID=UPI003720634E
MFDDIRAEARKLVRRPAIWTLLAVALTLSLIFTYIVPYAGYAGATDAGPTAGRGLASMLPDRLVGNSIGGLPVFLGALMLILGVLAVGSEYSWGTWKTLLTQDPSRLRVYAAKLVVALGAALVGVLAVFAFGAAASALIAAGESVPLDWPSGGDVLVGVGAGWLIAAMWTVLGALLAIALRGVALPVGLGLVWLLAVQNLLSLIAAPLLDWVAQLQKGLPGPNAGSLVAALGGGTDTPGVAALVDGGQAALVLAAYLVVFAVAGGVVLRRRDIL